ncbi:MAG: efflux RND transporter permease subunit [Hyphomonadaceae bacterium]
MTLSDLSVRRPVLATVFSLIIIAFGAISVYRGCRCANCRTSMRRSCRSAAFYPGASAQVGRRRRSRVIEDQLSGIDGIDTINATSRDGPSSINIEFTLDRNLEDATNDVRNAVDRARGSCQAGY